jgi:hypothetical protein
MYDGYSPTKFGGLVKWFKGDEGVQKLKKEEEKNQEALLRQKEAYGEVVRLEDDEGKLRTLRRKKKKKKKKPKKKDLIIVRTPYGEAKFYKNADGSKSKVKLRKKKLSSPIGMESRPILFNAKANLKEIEALDEDDEP